MVRNATLYSSAYLAAERRERYAVGGVLTLEPAAPEAELNPAAAHLIDLRHGDRERTRQPERRRGHHGPEPDAAGLDGQGA
jgi:hypothetical protein